MELADNYDALRTERPDKKAFPHERCRAIILEQPWTYFDPVLVDAFIELETDFKKTSEVLAD